MNQIATVTSKKQLTLPSAIFKKAGFKIGQKVMVSEENGRLLITPAEVLVEEFAGPVPVPKKGKGKDAREIVNEAKSEYFQKKYRLK